LVIVGRSITRNSARNVRVTSERIEANAPPATPSSVVAASGRPSARFLSPSRTLSSAFPVETIFWNQSCCWT
jgi:hypothetical protein